MYRIKSKAQKQRRKAKPLDRGPVLQPYGTCLHPAAMTTNNDKQKANTIYLLSAVKRIPLLGGGVGALGLTCAII